MFQVIDDMTVLLDDIEQQEKFMGKDFSGQHRVRKPAVSFSNGNNHGGRNHRHSYNIQQPR
jgi:hypothetical protein